jgi:hypothetical protein
MNKIMEDNRREKDIRKQETERITEEINNGGKDKCKRTNGTLKRR